MRYHSRPAQICSEHNEYPVQWNRSQIQDPLQCGKYIPINLKKELVAKRGIMLRLMKKLKCYKNAAIFLDMCIFDAKEKKNMINILKRESRFFSTFSCKISVDHNRKIGHRALILLSVAAIEIYSHELSTWCSDRSRKLFFYLLI